MAEIGRYPLKITIESSDSMLVVSSSGDTVRIPYSALSEFLPETFIGLKDTPGFYVGNQGKGVIVNSAEDGLEFLPSTTSPTLITLPDTPGSYAAQAGKVLKVNTLSNAVEFDNTTFTENTDTPVDYVGQGGKLLKVNVGETGVEFDSEALLQLTDTPASYAGQAGKGLQVNLAENAVEFVLDTNNTVYLYSESDLPNQTATTWTMDVNTPYKLAATFSTTLGCIVQPGASLRGDNAASYILFYTGSGTMFTGVDTSFYISNIAIDPGITNQGFDFQDTGSGQALFLAETVTLINAAVWGTFNNMRLTKLANVNGLNLIQGLQLFGTSNSVISINELALFSTDAGFKGIDLGSAQAQVLELSNLFMTAPVGAFGVSGLVSSGNVPVGRLGMLNESEFGGGMTALENITSDDTRWAFRDNSPIPNTAPDALMSFSGNATETIIAASSTDGSNAVLVAGTWVPVQASHFTTTVAGRATYIAEKTLQGPVDVSVGLISAGGGGITVKVYIFLNGSVITASGIDVAISGSLAQTISIPWQITFTENDYVEVFVENQTGTTNIIVDHAILRIL